MGVLRFLLEKEFKLFIRNPFLPRMAVGFPLIIMLVLPLVTTMDIKNVNIGIVNRDNSSASRRLIQKIDASSYFTLKTLSADFKSAMNSVERGDIDLILEIPDQFEKKMLEGKFETLAITVNAVNTVKGNIGSNYLNLIIQSYFKEYYEEQGLQEKAKEHFVIKNLYNPTVNYRYFMIPALMVMLIIILCGYLPALNIVGEKETGTIEQMNVTPVSKFIFTLSKLIPYWLIGIVVLSIAMLVAKFVYGLAPQGSLFLIYGVALLFILTMSGVGLIVSNYSATLQQAMFIMFFFMMIFLLMSGLFTPIESMPQWAQAITRAVPPRYFIHAARGIYLKGSSFIDIYEDFLYLAFFAVTINLWAIVSYRKQA